VNELLTEDWLIGYLQGDVTLGDVLPLLRGRPTPLLNQGELPAGGRRSSFDSDSDQLPVCL
jgi:hypothetical protein